MMDSYRKYPEYLELFSPGGPMKVNIRFTNHDGAAAQLNIFPAQIDKLLCRESGAFHRYMTVDDWLIEVLKIEIKPKTNSMKITGKVIKD